MGIEKEHHWDIARDKAGAQIAELNLQAEQLKKGAADANARAAEATQKALEAQVALEKFKQPRLLSADRTRAMAEKLSQFAGTRFDGSVSAGDTEATIFLSR
jgi:hypothetical protein